MKRPRLNWRREPREPGLRGTVQCERGYELRHSGETVGHVSPLYEGLGRRKRGYYAYGSWPAWGVPRLNTRLQPVATVEEAQALLLKHFNEHIDQYLERHAV